MPMAHTAELHAAPRTPAVKQRRKARLALLHLCPPRLLRRRRLGVLRRRHYLQQIWPLPQSAGAGGVGRGGRAGVGGRAGRGEKQKAQGGHWLAQRCGPAAV